MRLPATALCLLGAVLASGCATNPVTGEQNLVLVSEQQEVSLGRQAHTQILKQYRASSDTIAQSYVDTVGQRLAAVSHRTNLRYTFTLLDSTEINAFALPGGYVYITRGLLAYMNSEAEMAAVLGHEIGHVTARHGVRQASSAQAASLGAGLLSVLFPQLGAVGLDQTLGLLGTAILRGYGREHELEADRLGAEYLAEAGYDPGAMLDVVRTLKNHELLDRKLARLEGRQPRAYHGLFATHPDNDTRLREVISHAGTLGEAGGERQRDRFLDHVDGMVFGENPAEGLFVDDRFVHPDLEIAFRVPAGWKTSNRPDQLVLADPMEQAYLLVRLSPVAAGTTPVAFVRALGVRDLHDARELDIAGLPAVAGLAVLQTDAGRRPARLVAVLHDAYGYVFAGFTRDPDALGHFDPAFLDVARSFHPITDAERALAAPLRLRVVRPRASVSWAALAAASPLRTLAGDRLRVLNAVPPGEETTGARRIKLVAGADGAGIGAARD